MKVLQRPLSDENWATKVYCTGFGHKETGCRARLKVFREDLRQGPVTAGGVRPVSFKCICCGALTAIGLESYPPDHKKLKPYKNSWTKLSDQSPD